jgi:hypothetical protein
VVVCFEEEGAPWWFCMNEEFTPCMEPNRLWCGYLCGHTSMCIGWRPSVTSRLTCMCACFAPTATTGCEP